MNRKIISLLILLFVPAISFAQFSVTGTVVSSEGNSPLPGATISNSHDSLIAVTDDEGKFKLSLFYSDSLVFSYLGFETKQVKVTEEDAKINVELIPEDNILLEVKVISNESGRPLREVAGGISLLQSKDIQRFDQTSLVPVLSKIPGVRMEQRSTGSYRISIRGSALRAPFDVRNVKVYWNNIPITEPGGNTPFNLFDNINFEKIEVLKGPSGSIYGAGIGGVLNIESPQPLKETKSLSIGYTGGSFGLKRHTANANFGDLQKAVRVTYVNQQLEGYREHSAFDRKNVGVSAVFTTGETSKLRTDILYTDLFYEIPGGLTKEQFDEDPKQARPGNQFTLGSKEANASISVKNLLAGVNYNTNLGSKAELHTTVYANLADFENPFNLDYKREAQQGYGGRIRANLSGNIAGAATKLTLGSEYQFRFAAARNYGNKSGRPDTLNFDDELRTRQFMIFGQYEVFFPANWILTAGLSANNIQYDIYRLIDSQGINGRRIEKNFKTQWIPRLSLVKAFDNIAFHGSISYGFSPPTLEEVRTNEGSINLDLEPEKGINYEAGVRGNAIARKVFYDVTLFYLRLQETIVDYTSDRGTDLFRNSGSTNQKGVEVALNYQLIRDAFAVIPDWSLTLSYAYHYFKFDEYIQGEGNYSGNDFTGVAPHTLWAGTDLTTSLGIYANISYNYTHEIPLNDANEVYADPYHLVLAKVGYKKKLGKRFILDLYAGVDNLLDQKYSLGNDLNAFGGRFYQPAPERNYYGGLALDFSL